MLRMWDNIAKAVTPRAEHAEREPFKRFLGLGIVIELGIRVSICFIVELGWKFWFWVKNGWVSPLLSSSIFNGESKIVGVIRNVNRFF